MQANIAALILLLTLCSCGRPDAALVVQTPAEAGSHSVQATSEVPTASPTTVSQPTNGTATQQISAKCATGCAAPVAGCEIKGIVGTAGEHFFLVPSQQSYKSATLDPSRGDRWFCTIEEATAAGWLPLKAARTAGQP